MAATTSSTSFPNGSDAAAAAAAAAALADPALGSAIFARLHPVTYLDRFLDNRIRPDGRAFDGFRDAHVGTSTIGTAHGSAIVRHGSTIIVAGVKGEWMDMSEEEETDGKDESNGSGDDDGQAISSTDLAGVGPVQRRRLVVGVDLTPMASARFKPGPPGDEAQVLASRLMALLDAAPPLAASSLVIEPEQLSWCLYVDLVCLSYDGNLLDACLLAVNAALHDTRLPVVAPPSDEGGALACSPTEARPLQLIASPLSFTFAIVHDTHLLCDPNAFESTMTDPWIVITLDAATKEGEMVAVQTSGRCSAVLSGEEAGTAGVQGVAVVAQDGDAVNGDMVRVRDEELIKVCLRRAQKQLPARRAAMTSVVRA